MLGDRVAVVDVGPTKSVESLVEGLSIAGVSPADIDYVLLTHIHIDHAGGVGAFLKHLPRAKVLVHSRGAPHLVDPSKLWESSLRTLGEVAEGFGGIKPVSSERIAIAEDGLSISLSDDISIRVLHTPGHASHHMSFFEEKSGTLFAGEAAGVHLPGSGFVRPAAPPPFDLGSALRSVEKLIDANPSIICYAHFGCSIDAMQMLRKYSQKLIAWSDLIARLLKEEKGVEEIYQELATKDDYVSYVENRLSGAVKQREKKFITNAVLGFTQYLVKRGRAR